MSNYKIIFIDIDGTLVDNKKQVSNETKLCLQKLVEKGIKIVLTSGRPYKSIVEYANECGLGNIHIGSNGAIVANIKTDEILFKKQMKVKTALEIIDAAIKNNIFVMVTINGNQYIQYKKWGISPMSRKDIIIKNDIKSLLNNKNTNVIKLVLLHSNNQTLEDFKKNLNKYNGISIVPVEVMTIPDHIRNEDGVCNNPYNLDIMASNISKSSGINCVLNYFGISKEQSIGIGDGLNDLDLFGAVGLKIAMKNANPKLKENADIISEFDNNNSGVAKVLNKIFKEELI